MGYIRLMNITEIRRKYLEKLEEKCASCFNKADTILVRSYNEIMNNKAVEIRRDYITDDDESNAWAKDVRKRILEHYSKDWDVTIEYRSYKKMTPAMWFIFKYKGDLAEVLPEPEVKKPGGVEEKLKRTGILDL